MFRFFLVLLRKLSKEKRNKTTSKGNLKPMMKQQLNKTIAKAAAQVLTCNNKLLIFGHNEKKEKLMHSYDENRDARGHVLILKKFYIKLLYKKEISFKILRRKVVFLYKFLKEIYLFIVFWQLHFLVSVLFLFSINFFFSFQNKFYEYVAVAACHTPTSSLTIVLRFNFRFKRKLFKKNVTTAAALVPLVVVLHSKTLA